MPKATRRRRAGGVLGSQSRSPHRPAWSVRGQAGTVEIPRVAGDLPGGTALSITPNESWLAAPTRAEP
jgi:hypothetical protein